jgi:meso-butanediol dehydrogenase/(S,S)-butanediol dehydrogenase/diacetyl reductase
MCNNAGLLHIAPFFESTLEDWQRVFQVNVGGVLLGTQRAALQMRRQPIDPDTGCRGKIVNVSSPAADSLVSTEAAYGASKAAVNHLTRNAAALLAGDLISVTSLYPGNVWEGMQSRVHQHGGDPPGPPAGPSARGKLESWPTGRWQRPDDTGDMVVFIAAYRGMDLNGQLVVSHPHRHRL